MKTAAEKAEPGLYRHCKEVEGYETTAMFGQLRSPTATPEPPLTDHGAIPATF